MAFSHLLLSLLLLSSLLTISSANYNYPYTTGQHPNVENDKQTLLDHDQLLDNDLIPTDHILDLGSTNGHNNQQYDHDHVLQEDQQKLYFPDQPLHDLLTPTKQDRYEPYYYHKSSEGKEHYLVPSEPAQYYEKPKPEGKENIVPVKLPYNVGEPKNYDQVYQRHIPTIKYIAIRGLVLCNSGQSYAPLPGTYITLHYN